MLSTHFVLVNRNWPTIIINAMGCKIRTCGAIINLLLVLGGNQAEIFRV